MQSKNTKLKTSLCSFPRVTSLSSSLLNRPPMTRQVRCLCKQNDNVDQDDSEVSVSPLAVTLSRIIVCKPQSADCERLISAYNRLKSDVRSPLDCETISDYLYVFVNM